MIQTEIKFVLNQDEGSYGASFFGLKWYTIAPPHRYNFSPALTPEDVRTYCKKLIDVCAVDGGYIMDASSPLAEAKPENIQAMYDFTREYGA